MSSRSATLRIYIISNQLYPDFFSSPHPWPPTVPLVEQNRFHTHVILVVVRHRAAASACWSPRLACGQAQAASRRVNLKVELSVYQSNKLKLILTSYLAPSTEPCSSKSSEPDLIVAKWSRELCFTEWLITLHALRSTEKGYKQVVAINILLPPLPPNYLPQQQSEPHDRI
jgi:hypothetical protein